MNVSFDTEPSRYNHWKLSFEGPVATLALDVAEDKGLAPGYKLKLNSYDLGVDIELADAVQRLRFEHPEVSCVVVTSALDGIFSSGANLAGFGADVPLVHKHQASQRLVTILGSIGEGKPTICAANGHVLAGSLGIALACDLIVAKESAQFGTPEINVGAFPYMIMALIYRNVGRKKTNELLLLGDRVNAQEAERIGIVNRVLPDAEFEDGVREWAEKLASKSPLIMRMGKQAMFRQQDMPLLDALEFLHAQLTITMSTEDLVEGVTAFFEKREPEWKGR